MRPSEQELVQMAQEVDPIIRFIKAATDKVNVLSKYSKVDKLTEKESAFVTKVGSITLIIMRYISKTEGEIENLSDEEIAEPMAILLDLIYLAVELCSVNSDMPKEEQTPEDENLLNCTMAIMLDMFCHM